MLRPFDPNRCPVDQALELIGGKWKPLILWRLSGGTLRFGELQRSIPAVTQRMLTLQLRELERDGLVVRTVYAEVPPKVEYTLTAPAFKLMPNLGSMGQWLIDHHAGLREQSAGAGRGASEPAHETNTQAGNVRVFRARN